MSNEITIQKSFSDIFLSSTAELYDAAFGAKLSIAIPNPILRKSILISAFQPDFSFVALHDGELVGIAGFQTEQGSLTSGISFHVLQETLGYFGAFRAALVLTLFQRKQYRGQLLVDGISVAPKMRGSGIGTKLLESLFDYAKHEGYSSVRLDVIDTNPDAMRLYDRVGFIPVKTEKFVYLKWLLGFGAITTMNYSLDALT